MDAPVRKPRFQRILVIKLADLGDVLCTTPALRALRHTFPEARIDLLTTTRGAGGVLCGGPARGALLDDAFVLEKFSFDTVRDILHPRALYVGLHTLADLRAQHYDTVILLHHLTLAFGALKHAALTLATGAKVRAGLDNGRGWFFTHRATDRGFGARHETQYWLDVVGSIGAATDDLALEVPVTYDDQVYADQLLGGFIDMIGRPTGGPLIALHPGSGAYSAARRWDLPAFAEVANTLGERVQARIVLLGTPADRVTELLGLVRGALNLEGKTTPAQATAVLRRCQVFIGADSGLMHLAAAAGTPTVALFGPSNADAWRPWQDPARVRVLRAGSACSPCLYVEHELGVPAGQPERTCMRLITPAQVVRAAEELLAHEPAPVEVRATPPVAPPNARPAFTVLGVKIDPVTYEDALERIAGYIHIADGVPRQVVTVNPEFVMAAQRDAIFRFIINRAALRLPDGEGIVWAARRLGLPPIERVTGIDMVQQIAARAAREGWRLFLLGAAQGVAADAATRLVDQHPGLIIAGTHAGTPAGRDEDRISAQVREARADILFVAYGAPAQDKWIARNLPRLGVAVALGVGGAFDFIVGRVPRAPEAWQKRRLEWLWRLRLEPWRWRRMLVLPRFMFDVLLEGEHHGPPPHT